MRQVRTSRQELQTLDYMGDILSEIAAMAGRDNHKLLGYILNSALIEIEDLKRLRMARAPSIQPDNHAAGLPLDTP